MSVARNLFFALGKALDATRLPAFGRRVVTALYTLYIAKDLGAFGEGSSIEAFSIFQSPGNIYLGSGTHVRAGCRIQAEAIYEAAPNAAAAAPLLQLGDGTLVGRYCHITASVRIEIGARVLMGERILIADHDHGFEDTSRAPRDQPLAAARPVSIGDACWIGDGAAILAGAKLGNHVVVGANAVVRGEVPAFTVVAGNPAMPVRRYDKDRGEWVKVDPDTTGA